MKPPLRPRSQGTPGYTLIEILVAMSILALGIAAASRLTLSQATTEEVVLKKAFAANFAENIARYWRIAATKPVDVLLGVPNSKPLADGTQTYMSYTIANPPTAITGGSDNGTNPITVESTTVTVNWLPLGATGSASLSYTILRSLESRR